MEQANDEDVVKMVERIGRNKITKSVSMQSSRTERRETERRNTKAVQRKNAVTREKQKRYNAGY